jgi:hypothetical protein
MMRTPDLPRISILTDDCETSDHSSLGYRPPAPAAWQTEASQGHGKVESKDRFLLSHTPYYGDGQISTSPAALH